MSRWAHFHEVVDVDVVVIIIVIIIIVVVVIVVVIIIRRHIDYCVCCNEKKREEC